MLTAMCLTSLAQAYAVRPTCILSIISASLEDPCQNNVFHFHVADLKLSRYGNHISR